MRNVRSPFDLIDVPIFVVTARHRERESGATATWVWSAGLLADRGRIIGALSPESFTAELMVETHELVINVLAEGQHALVPHFGLRSGRDTDKLRGLHVTRTRSGIAVL